MKSGAELIAEERDNQIEEHGYSVAHDAEYNDYYELAIVAQCLIMPPNQDVTLSEELNMLNALAENWDSEVLRKMLQKSYKDRLIIAGALLAAEIDRLQYLEGALPDGIDFFAEVAAFAAKQQEATIKADLETRSDLDMGEKPGYNNGRFQPADLSFDRTRRTYSGDEVFQMIGLQAFDIQGNAVMKEYQALWNPEKRMLYVSAEFAQKYADAEFDINQHALLKLLGVLILED